MAEALLKRSFDHPRDWEQFAGNLLLRTGRLAAERAASAPGRSASMLDRLRATRGNALTISVSLWGALSGCAAPSRPGLARMAPEIVLSVACGQGVRTRRKIAPFVTRLGDKYASSSAARRRERHQTTPRDSENPAPWQRVREPAPGHACRTE